MANIRPSAERSLRSRCPRRCGWRFFPPVSAWRRCDLDGLSTERPGLLCGTTDAATLNDDKSADRFLLRK